MAGATVVRRSWWRDWWRYGTGIVTQVLGNPVVARELRVRVRLARAYWLQALYLLFLLLIVGIAYMGTLGSQISMDPYRAQTYLQQFYWVIFGTLTALIVLIAPGLTAGAVTQERERRTLDLLLTTPLSARELLTGKLVGSFAFLVLLLALTLPASAVCVLLGGTTFGEVLESYFMLALSGLCLSAVALFTSAYSRSSMWAVFGGYLLCFFYLGATLPFTLLSLAMTSPGGSGGAGLTGQELLAPLGLLNPFSAPLVAGFYLKLGTMQIPAWVVSLVVCLLFVRLVMTGAARRVGLYDKDVLPSFRRQLLVVAGLYVYLMAAGFSTAIRTGGGGLEFVVLLILLIAGTMGLIVLLVSPIGRRDEQPMVDDGVFNLWRMFRASAAGALPYITLLWLVVSGAVVLGSISIWKALTLAQQMAAFTMMFYLYGVWVLLWGVARLASALVGHHGLGVARWFAITLTVALILVPLLLQALLIGEFPDRFEDAGPILWCWFPMALLDFIGEMYRTSGFLRVTSADSFQVMVGAGMGWLAVGLLLGLLTHLRMARRAHVP